jgi:hypothetical protein
MNHLYKTALTAFAGIFIAGTAVGQQNLIVGGDMESDEHWEVSLINSDVDIDYEFGYTDDTPAQGDGGSLMVSGEITGNPGNQLANIVFYQEITVVGGETYFFDAAFKDVDGVHQFWAEVSILPDAPEVGEDWGDHFSGFNTWGGCGPDVDGTFSEDGCEGEGDNLWTAPGEGEMTMYFGLKFGAGSWDAGVSNSFTILVDEVVLYNVNDTSVENRLGPAAFELSQNYPNPFNPTTNISFTLPGSSHVTLEVYSITGQRVAVLLNEAKGAGLHTVSFDGAGLSSGMYLYRLQAGDLVQTRKMQIIK